MGAEIACTRRCPAILKKALQRLRLSREREREDGKRMTTKKNRVVLGKGIYSNSIRGKFGGAFFEHMRCFDEQEKIKSRALKRGEEATGLLMFEFLNDGTCVDGLLV